MARTLPTSTASTLSTRAASWGSAVLRKRDAEELAITRRPSIRPKSRTMSSGIPSLRNCISSLPLLLWNGSTAIDVIKGLLIPLERMGGVLALRNAAATSRIDA